MYISCTLVICEIFKKRYGMGLGSHDFRAEGASLRLRSNLASEGVGSGAKRANFLDPTVKLEAAAAAKLLW